jgi:hypothetical protein
MRVLNTSAMYAIIVIVIKCAQFSACFDQQYNRHPVNEELSMAPRSDHFGMRSRQLSNVGQSLDG